MGIKIYWPLLFVATIILATILIFPSDLRLADLLGKAGKWQEAIQNYQKVLDKHPNRDDIRIELANLYLLNNQPEKAVIEYERAGADITEDPLQLNKLYQLYSSLGDKVKTIATLKKLVKVIPENAGYQTKLAEAYEWNNDTEHAIALYDELLCEKPEDIHILNKLIYLNLNKKDYGKTSHHLKRLLNLQPENQEARILLGNVYLQANQKEQAASEFEQVLKIDPQNASLRLQLAELYLWMPRYKKAMLHYEYLFMTHVLNDHYFNKLIDLTKNSDPAKAIKYYKYRLKYLPHDTELRAHFVDLYLYFGQTDEAVAQLQNLVANNPEDARYWLKLAKLYAILGEPQQANEIFETMFYRGYQNPDITRALIYYYKNEQEYDKLLKLYAILLQANKTTPKIQHDYAELLLRTHHYEAAQKQYLSLLKRQPQNLQTRMQLAKLYQFKKDDKDALKLIKQGIEKYDVREEEYLFYAGQLFAEHNQHKESIACFKKLAALD
ncbi:MAG: tetratricopeptide repeat protein, partial [bacterium]